MSNYHKMHNCVICRRRAPLPPVIDNWRVLGTWRMNRFILDCIPETEHQKQVFNQTVMFWINAWEVSFLGI